MEASRQQAIGDGCHFTVPHSPSLQPFLDRNSATVGPHTARQHVRRRQGWQARATRTCRARVLTRTFPGWQVFMKLDTGRAYCIPDNYEVLDTSLADIKHNLNPLYNPEQASPTHSQSPSPASLPCCHPSPPAGFRDMLNIPV